MYLRSEIWKQNLDSSIPIDNMKLTLLLLSFSGLIFSQNVDVDKNSIVLSHIYFPESPALSPLKSYQVRISEPAGFLSAHGMNRVMLSNNFY